MSDWMAWGLRSGSGMGPINARVETADTKPTFRGSWRAMRCAIPADGWYEWRLENGKKQPYFFQRRDGEPIFFAGLWADDTFCIITTAADGDLTLIHDRRPLALPTSAARQWIEKAPASTQHLIDQRVPASDVGFHGVSARVSSSVNDGADLIGEMNIIAAARPFQPDLFPNPA